MSLRKPLPKVNAIPGVKRVPNGTSKRVPIGKRSIPGVHAVDESDDDETETESESESEIESAVSELDESTSSVPPPLRPKSPYQPGHEEGVDESLWKIANTEKAKKKSDSADSSERVRARKSVGDAFRPKRNHNEVRVAKLPPPPSQRAPQRVPQRMPQRVPQRPSQRVPQRPSQRVPQRPSQRVPQRPSQRDVSSSLSLSSDEFDEDDEDSSSGSLSSSSSQGMTVDPIEEETIKAVRKAKLLARIEQMQAKGVKTSKNFNYRSNEEEMMVEVAKMEVLAERSIRIEQGRALLLPLVTGIESGLNFVDRKQWLPVKANMNGFSNQLAADIDKYDDCLERGVAETIGPAGGHAWWVDLMMILGPSMLHYSFMSRLSSTPTYANELLNNNPSFRAEISGKMAQELSHAEKQRRLETERELARVQQENLILKQNQMRAQSQMQMPPSSQMPMRTTSQMPPNQTVSQSKPSISLPSPSTSTSTKEVKFVKPVPSKHPLGDLPVDGNATREMHAFIESQKQKQKQQQQQQQTQTSGQKKKVVSVDISE